MKTLLQTSTLALQVFLLIIIAGCGSGAANRPIEEAPALDSSREEASTGGNPEVQKLRLPTSAQIAPSDVLDQVIFLGTGGEEGIGCPCIDVRNNVLYLEGFHPNQSLRLVAYDEYKQGFGNYFAEWQVTIDSLGFLAIPLDNYQSNITFVAYDSDTGKQRGPANQPVIPGTPPPDSSIAWISDEVTEVNLRSTPGYSNKNDAHDVITKIPSSESVEILDGPFSADGLNWWLVSWEGFEGYIADHTGNGRTILIFP
ncbi:MAG: SH3 domain-containing protein [Anaerolineales bacterium]